MIFNLKLSRPNGSTMKLLISKPSKQQRNTWRSKWYSFVLSIYFCDIFVVWLPDPFSDCLTYCLKIWPIVWLFRCKSDQALASKFSKLFYICEKNLCWIKELKAFIKNQNWYLVATNNKHCEKNTINTITTEKTYSNMPKCLSESKIYYQLGCTSYCKISNGLCF